MIRSAPRVGSRAPGHYYHGDYRPEPKRVTLLPPSPATAAVSGAAATNSATIGSKPLPSLLYRSLSEPIDSLGVLNTQTAENPNTEEFRSLSAFGQFLNSLILCRRKIPRLPAPHGNSGLSSPSIILWSHCRFRVPAATPPRPSVAAQTIKSPRSSAEESPNTKVES